MFNSVKKAVHGLVYYDSSSESFNVLTKSAIPANSGMQPKNGLKFHSNTKPAVKDFIEKNPTKVLNVGDCCLTNKIEFTPSSINPNLTFKQQVSMVSGLASSLFNDPVISALTNQCSLDDNVVISTNLDWGLQRIKPRLVVNTHSMERITIISEIITTYLEDLKDFDALKSVYCKVTLKLKPFGSTDLALTTSVVRQLFNENLKSSKGQLSIVSELKSNAVYVTTLIPTSIILKPRSWYMACGSDNNVISIEVTIESKIDTSRLPMVLQDPPIPLKLDVIGTHICIKCNGDLDYMMECIKCTNSKSGSKNSHTTNTSNAFTSPKKNVTMKQSNYWRSPVCTGTVTSLAAESSPQSNVPHDNVFVNVSTIDTSHSNLLSTVNKADWGCDRDSWAADVDDLSPFITVSTVASSDIDAAPTHNVVPVLISEDDKSMKLNIINQVDLTVYESKKILRNNSFAILNDIIEDIVDADPVRDADIIISPDTFDDQPAETSIISQTTNDGAILASPVSEESMSSKSLNKTPNKKIPKKKGVTFLSVLSVSPKINNVDYKTVSPSRSNETSKNSWIQPSSTVPRSIQSSVTNVDKKIIGIGTDLVNTRRVKTRPTL